MVIVAWLCLAFVAGVIEAETTALVSIWFAVGAVCSAIAAALGFSVLAQWLIFLIISVVLLLATFPLCKKLRKKPKNPTNADRLIGTMGIITEDVDPVLGTGEVKVKGQLWSVQLRGDGKAKVGDVVKIEEIVGVHLVASLAEISEGDEK